MAHKKAKKKKKAKARIAITITDGTPPVVNPDSTHLSKKNDVAHWDTNPPGQDFLVIFEGNSPFDEWFFHKGNKTSKVTVVNAGPTEYKYTVYTASGAHEKDPGVIIRP